MAVFPECATTGYFKEEITRYAESDYLEAERSIAEACKRHGIHAVVGTPYFENGVRYSIGLSQPVKTPE